MVELWIEDKLVDLSGDEDIAIDYSIAKIGEIQTRSGAISIPIRLPKTANNRLIFENPDDVNSISSIPYRRLNARLLVDGINQNILFCTLDNSNSNYNIRIYGTNADIFNQMKNVSLQDLNFCAYDHFWTRPNVANTRTNADGFVYPIIDYNYDSPNGILDNSQRNIEASNMFPSVYVHSVFNAIADYFGITINNEIENTANYPVGNLLVPFSKKSYTRVRAPYRYEHKFSASTDIPLNSNVGAVGGFPSPGVWIEFDTNEGCSDYWNYGNFDDYFQFAEKIKATATFNLTFNAQAGLVGDTPFFVSICTDILDVLNLDPDTYGIDWIDYNITVPGFGSGSVNITGSFTFTTRNRTGFWKDAFFMFISSTASVVNLEAGSHITFSDIEILEDRNIIYSTSEEVDNFVTIGSVLPEWNCAEFIKQYCLMFGAIISHNAITNEFNIIPFKKIVDNINSFIDWSDKLDFSIDFDVSSNIGEYAQRNHLRYANDSEVSKPSGTDYYFDISNENLKAEADIIELAYGATQTALRLINIEVPQIKVYQNDGDEFQGCETQRILVNKYYDTADFANTVHLSYLDGGGSLNVTTDLPIPYFILSDEAFNLGFGDNISETYYKVLIDILTNAKRCVLPIRLNASDINQLDFTKPVYIKHFNAYFYISQIKAYTPTNNESTMVELVKLF